MQNEEPVRHKRKRSSTSVEYQMRFHLIRMLHLLRHHKIKTAATESAESAVNDVINRHLAPLAEQVALVQEKIKSSIKSENRDETLKLVMTLARLQRREKKIRCMKKKK